MISFQSTIDLAPYTTFGVHANARLFVEITSEAELLELLASPEWSKYPHIFLGSGANILFTQDYPGIVVKVSLTGRKILKETSDSVELLVGAGENWNDLVLRTVQQWWGGLENLVGIPSSVGAAAVGNIGAYGIEAKDRITSVQGIDIHTWITKTLTSSECQFGYRESIFKHELKDSFVITGVCFRLEKFSPKYVFVTNYREIQTGLASIEGRLSLEKLALLITSIRDSKLPDRRTLGTAGSFFKNPIVSLDLFEYLREGYPNLVSFNIPDDKHHVKLSAGQLIELVGLKWHKQGNVGVYEKHALILVNYGEGTGHEIVNLAKVIQGKVKEKFWVSLESEVIYV